MKAFKKKKKTRINTEYDHAEDRTSDDTNGDMWNNPEAC